MAINMPAIADPMKSEAYERERKKVVEEERASKPKETSSPMLQGEGKIRTYKELAKSGKRGDNITPHHMLSTEYSK